MNQALEPGAFVRVKASSDHRAGQDGMVMKASDGQAVGLVFCFDRFGRHQGETGAVVTGLTEAWTLDELDLSSVEHCHGKQRMKAGHEFEYQGIRYRVAAVGAIRWTHSGLAVRVYAMNSATGLGGRYFDLRESGLAFRFSPD